ncbi:MAG TPA: DUF2336 domain-containing protein [Bradyrhizobium sp.]
MTLAASTALIAELEGAVQGGSSERRVRMLRQVTDLFLSDADRLNEKQIGVFDDVLVCLIERVEARTLAQLSVKLSDTGCAPKEVVRQLAFHEEAAVAVPVLAKSNRLSDADLIEIARTRGQRHLLAISGRSSLAAPLTDVLLKRGDSSVSLALAKNSGARFSEAGYSSLVERAERDDTLAEKLGLRLDIPANLLRDLLAKAAAAVGDRLLKAAAPEMRARIQQAIGFVAEQVGVDAPEPVDYSEAETKVLALNRAGKLGDQTINRFAIQEEHTNIVAALSLLSTVKIDAVEPLLRSSRPDGLIVACKAARLNWSTTMMILRCRPGCPPLSKIEMAEAKEVFETLSLSAAQRTIRFWSARNSAAKADAPETAVAVSDI